jgi:Ca2+-binding RTX toxin-like protein
MLYGTATTTRTGNTTYGFGSNASRAIFDAAAYPNVAYTIFDNGGSDTLNYSGYASNQRISLRAETFSNVGTGVGNVSIARGVIIENAIGGSGNDELIGNTANNVLDGGAGADRMSGEAGNDTYAVDNADDVVVEAAASGTDTVRASATYTLSVNVENLALTGLASINGTGNSLANTITGNAAANTLSSLGGNDTLDGGAGADTLVGGTGNDIYLVDNSGDVIAEATASGTDTVKASVTHTLAANVEKLTLTGAAAINGTGNDLANIITGNAAANVLSGGAGADQLKAGGGNDTLFGGEGSDTLTGSAGSDKFMFDAALNATTNVDRIVDFSVVNDTIGLDMSYFTQLSAGTLSASAFHTGTAAHDADDRVIYDKAAGKLYYDADGNGVGAAVLFATLGAGLALTNADFLVVS